MTTLQQLCDIAPLYKRSWITPEQCRFVESRLFSKLNQISHAFGEPLKTCQPFAFAELKHWLDEPQTGYEIHFNDTSTVRLFHWMTDHVPYLLLLDRPNDRRQLPFEWYIYDQDRVLTECLHGLIRNSPDIGLFVEQMSRVFMAAEPGHSWITKQRLYDIRLSNNVEVIVSQSPIEIPVGISYKE